MTHPQDQQILDLRLSQQVNPLRNDPDAVVAPMRRAARVSAWYTLDNCPRLVSNRDLQHLWAPAGTGDVQRFRLYQTALEHDRTDRATCELGPQRPEAALTRGPEQVHHQALVAVGERDPPEVRGDRGGGLGAHSGEVVGTDTGRYSV